jgi:hypothetical protein
LKTNSPVHCYYLFAGVVAEANGEAGSILRGYVPAFIRYR